MSEVNEGMMPKPGRVSWNELVTGDAGAASGFYGKLFGWKAEPFAPGGATAGGSPYMVFKQDANDMGVGGMIQMPAPGAPSQWVPYFVVANADTALAQAVSLGATVCAPVMAIPMVGRVAVLQDPQGATFGLHELASCN